MSAATRNQSETQVSSSEAREVRADLIRRVQRQLALGLYETDAKINGAIDKLVDAEFNSKH